jgi:hypothetical protein
MVRESRNRREEEIASRLRKIVRLMRVKRVMRMNTLTNAMEIQ